MQTSEIDLTQFKPDIFNLWHHRWFLLTCGNFEEGHFNTMTVSWGSFGIMWNKPFAQVVVRPTRFTYEFMEKYNQFTLSSFPEKYRKALNLLGSKSGRGVDKIKISGLNPVASNKVKSPVFAEADLTLECRKIYWNDLNPANFLSPQIGEHYSKNDHHREYFGEIVSLTDKRE